MNKSAKDWTRASTENPCPICGHTNACLTAPDGSKCSCVRVERGAYRSKNGWHLHKLNVRGNSSRAAPGALRSRKPEAKVPPKAWPTAQAAVDAACRSVSGRLVAEYIYHDIAGGEVFRVIRLDTGTGGKQFRPLYPEEGHWRLGDPPSLLPIYQIPLLAESKDEVVFVVEGEKAANAAQEIGLPATTSAHGAASPRKSDWSPLAGRDVVILPDADEAGERYAHEVAKLLMKLSPPARVKILRLPNLPAKGDIVEFIADCRAKGVVDVASKVKELAAQTEPEDRAEIIGGPRLKRFSDIEPVPVNWLWLYRIAVGRLSVLVGRPGEGKSFVTLDMAAHVSTGKAWPDGTPCPTGSILMISSEDNPSDTIRPRLDALGADCTKVVLLDTVRHLRTDGTAKEVMFTLHDLGALEEALQRLPDCKLIVVDPIGSFLGGGTDAHRDNEVRSILAPLAMLAEKYDVAVVIVAHRRKGMASSADELTLGSRAFTGIARNVWHVTRDANDSSRRLFLSGKNNLAAEGDGLAFRITGTPAQVVWVPDPVQMSADDAILQERGEAEMRRGPKPDTLESAKKWLQMELECGSKFVGTDPKPEPGTLRAAATDAGLSWGTVRRAMDALNVIRERCPLTKRFRCRLPVQSDGRCASGPNEGNLSNMRNMENCSEIDPVSDRDTRRCASSFNLRIVSEDVLFERGEI